VSEVYTKPDAEPMAKRTGPASFRRQIEAVKGAVRIEDVTTEYGAFRLMGAGRLLGRCVSPEHEDKTPSMHIFTIEQRFKCFGIGCGEHGDVLDLVQLAEGCELWEAMMILSQRYGIPLPERPQAWFRRQERQKPVRDAIGQARHDLLKRRLFRAYFMPLLARIEDVDEREAEYRILWETTDYLARMLLRDLASTKPGNEGRAS